MTKEKTRLNFKEHYRSLGKLEKIEFLNMITTLCLVSHETVKTWLYQSRVPSLLAQKTISDKLGKPIEELFN